MKRRNNTGFTLLELMIVVAIIAILALLAAPSFQGTLKRQRVEGAAEGFLAALQNAKAEAIKTNSMMRIAFTPTTATNLTAWPTNATIITTWCYGMTKAGDATCVCTVDADATNDCATGSVVQSTEYNGVSMNFNSDAYRTFNPLRGTSNGGTVIFFANADNSISLGVTTLGIGRNRVCRPTNTTIGSYSNNGAC
jgi:prepilin-type N-terminal cleavage/methylation domain-containing protein